MGALPWPPVISRSPGAQRGVEDADQDDDDDDDEGEDKDGSSSGQEVSSSDGEWFLGSGCCAL